MHRAYRYNMILDLPGTGRRNLTEFFCYSITHRELHNFQFSFDGLDKTPRVIIRGNTREVLKLVDDFYQHSKE